MRGGGTGRPESGISDLSNLVRAVFEGEEFIVVVCAEPGSPASVGPPELVADLGMTTVALEHDQLVDGGPALAHELGRALEVAGCRSVLLIPPLGLDRKTGIEMSEVVAASVRAALPHDVRFAVSLLLRTVGRVPKRTLVDEVIGDRYVSHVVSLPGPAVFGGQVHSSLRMALVALSSDPPDRVKLLDIGSLSGLGEAEQELRLLESGHERTSRGFSVSGPLDVSEGFLPAQVDPAAMMRVRELAELGAAVRLDELFEVLPGRQREEVAKRNGGAVVVVTGRVVHAAGLRVDAADRFAEADVDELLRPGDIVLRRVRHPGSAAPVAMVSADDPPLVAGQSVVVLRPRVDLPDAQRAVICSFLGSRRFADQLVSSMTGGFSVSLAELRSTTIPLPDDDLSSALESIQTAIDRFRAWSDEASDVMVAALESEDLAAARRNAIAKSNLVRQRADAAAALDDLGHRISTRYPLPLAYRWRAAMAAEGSPGELEAVLHAQEILLSYLACLSVVTCRLASIELGHLRDLRGRLANRRGAGISIGDWRALLFEMASSKAVRRLGETHPLVELRGFFKSDDVLSASDRLTERRNDRAHLRQESPMQLGSSLSQAWSDLDVLYRAAEFVCDYPLIRVLEVKWDSFEGVNELVVQRLTGDQAAVPRSSTRIRTASIEAGSLYVLDRDSQPILLRPLLVGLDCPDCGRWSTFAPDRLSETGGIEYKSLEHGHTHVIEDSRALREVGLLPD